MINRTKINNSIYDILNKDPKVIKKYIEKQSKKTSEQLEKEKEKRNKKSNITNINLEENLKNQETNPANQVVIHTVGDNLTHNYFYYFDLYWDAGDPLSSATLKMPKTDTGNTKYWITYTDEIDIYLGNDIERETKQTTNASNHATSNETYWSIQGMRPIFKGDIGRIKEYQDELEIHIDSIGKRFKQKIPDEFRQAYINNQNVRDAFVAICEFIGVKPICPPGAPPEQDEETATNSAQTDGTENNVDNKTNQEQALASAANAAANTAAQNASNGSSDPNAATTTEDPNALTEDQAQTDIQNGYADIAFDASGAIVHGSTAIETSPDMEDTLIAMEDHPLDKYLDDTTYVATDVKRFLDGEYFPTLHGNYLDYGSISIQPKSAPSSDVTALGNTGTTNTGNTSNNQGNNSIQDLDVMQPTQSAIGLQGITIKPNNNLLGPGGNLGSSGTMFK